MYDVSQPHTGQNGGVSQAFGGPAPRLSRNVPDYVGPDNLFTVVVPTHESETLHEVAVVVADLFHRTPDTSAFCVAYNDKGEAVLSTQTQVAVGFVAINNALRAVADRHQFRLPYTYGPVAVVAPSVSVHDLQEA